MSRDYISDPAEAQAYALRGIETELETTNELLTRIAEALEPKPEWPIGTLHITEADISQALMGMVPGVSNDYERVNPGEYVQGQALPTVREFAHKIFERLDV